MGRPIARDPVWVGVDVGTQSVRAVALDDTGRALGRASRSLDSTRSPGRHEQDAERWWQGAAEALRETTSACDAERIAGVAVSATSGTVVVLDPSGVPVTPGVMYDDTRGAPFVERVNDVGQPVWSRLGYRMQGSWALPAVLWLLAHQQVPDGGRIAHQADVVTWRLAGEQLATDSSHALKTGADLDAMDWPHAVFDELGLDAGLLPRLVEPGSVIGAVGRDGAAATGLPVGCAIVAGMTDGCAAQIGAGALLPGTWNSVLGTTLVVKGVSGERRPDPTGSVYSHRAPFGAGWFPGGASSTGAGAVAAWLPDADLTALTAAVAAAQPVPVSYPLVGVGERFPFVAPDARAFFDDGDDLPADPAHLFADITYGVSYVERLAFELMDRCGYDTEGPVTFTGGGSRNEWWNQLRCDLLDRPVRVPGQCDGATGMAVLAAAALGLEDGPAHGPSRLALTADRLLPAARALEPDRARHALLLNGYRSFIDRVRERGWLAGWDR